MYCRSKYIWLWLNGGGLFKRKKRKPRRSVISYQNCWTGEFYFVENLALLILLTIFHCLLKNVLNFKNSRCRMEIFQTFISFLHNPKHHLRKYLINLLKQLFSGFNIKGYMKPEICTTCVVNIAGWLLFQLLSKKQRSNTFVSFLLGLYLSWFVRGVLPLSYAF